MNLPAEIDRLSPEDPQRYLDANPSQQRWSTLRILPEDGVTDDDLTRLQFIPELEHLPSAGSIKVLCKRISAGEDRGHEATHLRPPADRRRAAGPPGRPPLPRRLHPPPLPDPPGQRRGPQALARSPPPSAAAAQTVRNAIRAFARRGRSPACARSPHRPTSARADLRRRRPASGSAPCCTAARATSASRPRSGRWTWPPRSPSPRA